MTTPSPTIQASLLPSSSRFHSETSQKTATAPRVRPTQAAAPMPRVWIRAPAATPSGMKPLTLVGLPGDHGGGERDHQHQQESRRQLLDAAPEAVAVEEGGLGGEEGDQCPDPDGADQRLDQGIDTEADGRAAERQEGLEDPGDVRPHQGPPDPGEDERAPRVVLAEVGERVGGRDRVDRGVRLPEQVVDDVEPVGRVVELDVAREGRLAGEDHRSPIGEERPHGHDQRPGARPPPPFPRQDEPGERRHRHHRHRPRFGRGEGVQGAGDDYRRRQAEREQQSIAQPVPAARSTSAPNPMPIAARTSGKRTHETISDTIGAIGDGIDLVGGRAEPYRDSSVAGSVCPICGGSAGPERGEGAWIGS